MALITPLKGESGSDTEKTSVSRTIDDGPPPSGDKAKKVQPKGSLFAQSVNGLNDQNSLGLGPEGSDPSILGMQSMGRLMNEVKTLSAMFPGIVPVLSDLVGRLQIMVPQLAQDLSNGGTGLVPMGGMPLPQPGGPGMGAGMPPPMPPPGMGGPPPMQAPMQAPQGM